MRPVSYLALTLCLLQPAIAFGWGGTGHQIVYLIAEGHLTPHAKEAIAELLDGASISDGEIASWADEVRRQRSETSPWHYVNIPVEAAGFDRARDGRNGDNIIDAIEKQSAILADKSASKDARAEALKFLVHVVGDINQPLHCANRNGDKGGNKRLVFYPGQKQAVSLHAVWDSQLLRDAMKRRRVLDYARMLDRKISLRQRREWQKGRPEDWANESHGAAVSHAYANLPPDGPPPTLDANYAADNERVVDGQLQKEGVRLAAVLNAALRSGDK